MSSRSIFLTVQRVIAETADAVSVEFDAPLEYRPGQFLTLRVPSDRTGSVARCYSLASTPGVDPFPKVTVKRTAAGYASNWICDNVKVGDQLESLPPSGVFTPADLATPLLLVAAGSGITPVIAIAKAALHQGSAPVTLFYANRSTADTIFGEEIATLATQFPDRLQVIWWLEDRQGLPTIDAAAAVAASNAGHLVYLCGPSAFMDLWHDGLAKAGVPHQQVHTEPFNSLTGDPFADVDTGPVTAAELADAAAAKVELDGTVHELVWPRDRTLVEVMLAADIDVPYSCQEGECGSCACNLVSGTVEMANHGALDEEDVADGYILGCQARPTSSTVEIQF